jgi:hypothetical protein
MVELRRAAWAREAGRCAVTGLPLGDVDGGGYHLHHRRPAGLGGTSRPDQDSLGNVLCLLPRVHLFGAAGLVIDGVPGRSVHGDPGWAGTRGLLLPTHENDPGSVEVFAWNVHGGLGWYRLSDDGCVAWVDRPPPAGASPVGPVTGAW